MLTEEQRARILELHRKGLSRNRIAKELDISWDTVNRVLKALNESGKIEKAEKVENIREEFERVSRIFQYEIELERMKEEIAREKENADDYKLYMLKILEKKVNWAAENVENCDEEIMERIRSEFREAIGIPCGEIVDRMLENYREVRRFEQERGMSIDEMKAFVEENSDLVLDLKKLRNQRRALKREISRLNRERDGFPGKCVCLGT